MVDFIGSPDETIHQIIRLKIMAALAALPASESLEFTRLRAITQASDGNLATHLTTLENANYVTILKDFNGKKPRTRIGITPLGRVALQRHTNYLRAILDHPITDETPPDHAAMVQSC